MNPQNQSFRRKLRFLLQCMCWFYWRNRNGSNLLYILNFIRLKPFLNLNFNFLTKNKNILASNWDSFIRISLLIGCHRGIIRIIIGAHTRRWTVNTHISLNCNAAKYKGNIVSLTVALTFFKFKAYVYVYLGISCLFPFFFYIEYERKQESLWFKYFYWHILQYFRSTIRRKKLYSKRWTLDMFVFIHELKTISIQTIFVSIKLIDWNKFFFFRKFNF